MTPSQECAENLSKRIEGEYCNLETEELSEFRVGRCTINHLFPITHLMKEKVARTQTSTPLYGT